MTGFILLWYISIKTKIKSLISQNFALNICVLSGFIYCIDIIYGNAIKAVISQI